VDGEALAKVIAAETKAINCISIIVL
jgi:hypothetical protein